MGKSTTAKIFAEYGAAVWDADAAVSRLYSKGGVGVDAIRDICPNAVVDGAVNRNALKRWIANDGAALEKIESVIHPLVVKDRKEFLQSSNSDVVVLDIPLLLETNQKEDMDLVCVVSASQESQRQRVLDRPGMTEEQFEIIRSKQMPDSEKRAKADYVIPTETLDETRKAVSKIMTHVRKKLSHA